MTQNEASVIKRFREKFVQYDKWGTPVGGFEFAPYERIEQFILSELSRVREETMCQRCGDKPAVQYCEECREDLDGIVRVVNRSKLSDLKQTKGEESK